MIKYWLVAEMLDRAGFEYIKVMSHDVELWARARKDGSGYDYIQLEVPCQDCLDKRGNGEMTGEVADMKFLQE